MQRQIRVMFKIGAVILLTLIFIWIIYMDEAKLQMTQPEGELIRIEDVVILAEELLYAGVQPKDPELFGQMIQKLRSTLENINDTGQNIQYENLNEKQGIEHEAVYITYEEYCTLWQALTGKWENVPGKQQSKLKNLQEKMEYEKKYKAEFYLLKKDWYAGYDNLLAYYGLTEIIREENVEILCMQEQIVGNRQLENNRLLTAGGEEYTYLSPAFETQQYVAVKAYLHEDRLLTLTEILPDTFTLKNVWVMEADKEGLQFFYQDYEMKAPWNQLPEQPKSGREQIADVAFAKGKIKQLAIKEQRISGKLVRLNETEAEVEGYGVLPFDEAYKGYRLYEELEQVNWDALPIGYDFADFVIEDGKICGFLLLRKEEMEYIRVLLRNNGFGSMYQEQVEVRCQEEMRLLYGSYDNRKEVIIPAGEVITFTSDSGYLQGDRVKLAPVAQSGKLEVVSLDRSQGIPAYRGSLEITDTENGLVLINEVLLEEYLYSVVPSEMPASYPAQALNAQAVCARTYAYRYMLNPGLGNLGAHVDDSTAYQVYNNIEENVNSTKAVKETSGELLLYEEKPATTYYYSTSCGYGADERVWQKEPEPELPYLQPVKIAGEGKNMFFGQEEEQINTEENEQGREETQKHAWNPEDMTEEKNFETYILAVDETSYEKNEAWYRWSCEVENLDAEDLFLRLKERYQAVPEKILTWEEKEDKFVSREPKSFKEIYDIYCSERLPGGVMNELVIQTDRGIFKIISEYNIRYILNQDCKIRRQDGSEYAGGSLLPSAYMVVKPVKQKELVTGYQMIGGGYGHGAGMSQNGAKNMALSGLGTEEILMFFFPGCQMEKIY